MLTASQILELVKGGEGYNVDFKRSVPSKVKEISDEATKSQSQPALTKLMYLRLSKNSWKP